MSRWQFYPLAEFPASGLLVKDGKEPFAAHFWTPEQAKAAVPRKLERSSTS